MIKSKSSIRLFITFSILLFVSTFVYATDLQLGFHFDNYNPEAKNTFGGSVKIIEDLTDNISIHAVVENQKNNAYSAYCAGGYDGKFLNFLGYITCCDSNLKGLLGQEINYG